jgi:hypothetical protein
MAEFDDFLAAYGKKEADFVWYEKRRFDSKVQDFKVVEKLSGGPLKGLEDFASRVPVLTTAYLTQNGTQIHGNFEHWRDRLGVRDEELERHFKYCNLWFYFSNAQNGELSVRLEEPGHPTEKQIHTHKAALVALIDFKNSAVSQDNRFTKAYLLDSPDIVLSTRLSNPQDKVIGPLNEYWESYLVRMIKPLVKLANGVVPTNQ